jgi:hypothetical protein
MRGELVAVWGDTWVSIWEPLTFLEGVPSDIFCELYREIANVLAVRPTIEELADILDSQEQSEQAFQAVRPGDFHSERRLVSFFEAAYEIIDDLAGNAVSNEYMVLLRGFFEKYSIRYQLQPPCVICPTLPGIFASLVRDLQASAGSDAHIAMLFNDFEQALRDLRNDCSDGKIKTVLQKEVNLLEAFGSSCEGVQANQLGAICGELKSWPHAALRKSLTNLYGFASDYPGIRHAGNPAGVLRPIDLKDLLSLSVVLAGFTPYLRDNFDPGVVLWGQGGTD